MFPTFVKIKCGNRPIQTTEVVKERLEANWNQSFTFDGLRLSEQDLQTTDLVIEVYSRNNFFQNDLKNRYVLKITHGFRPIIGFLWNKDHMEKPDTN